jgi:NAD(P)-dependent dehydrogenase (short-subunit alcohol dehydrogenase family)
MGELEGRIAVVTGGSRGIGRAISIDLAKAGAAVAISYRRDADAASETIAAIESAGGTAVAIAAAADDEADCQRLVDGVLASLGGIDILVCNAGIASRGRSVASTDADEVQRVMAVHALGPHYLSRFALPSMRQRAGVPGGRGDIVMISSVATTLMSAHGAPYNMGKAAMEALALTLAKEERPNGIHVNVVAPGLVETDMGVRLTRAITGNRDLADLRSLDSASPFGRVCQPSDIAGVVRWLCGPGAGYVTGQRIEVDGGGR